MGSVNLILFISLLFSLQIFYWIIGKRAAKGLTNQEDYFLASKQVRFFPLMMTFLATQVGGGLVLGAADEAYRFGWIVFLYPLGASLGLILLGLGVGKRLAAFQVSTVAQILEVVYRSPFLKKIASILSILSLFMILVAQIIASSKFLMSLGISNAPLFIAFWAIVIFYTAQGGLKAVISTDLAQAAFFSVVFLSCFGLILYSEPQGIFQLSKWAQFEWDLSKVWGWLFMPLLFMVIEQDMGQRCFAGSSPQVVSRASLWAGITTFAICMVPIFLGVLAKNSGLSVPKQASVLMAIVANKTPQFMTACVGCAVLAAIISTATSLINAISSNLSHDFQFRFISQGNSIRIAQVLTGCISIMAIFFAFYFDNIIDLLIQSYELSVSSLFVAIAMALIKKRAHFISALLSILFGGVAFCLFRVFPIAFPKELASVFLSFVGYASGDWIAWYRNKVGVSKRTELMEEKF